MARLTLEQIKNMIPNFDSAVSSMGYTYGGLDDDNVPIYYDQNGDGVQFSDEDIQNLVGNSNGELTNFQTESLRDQGVINATTANDVSKINSQYGTNFQGGDDYWNYVYGGGDRVGDYWVLPEGQKYDQYANNPLSVSHFDSFDKTAPFVKAGLLGMIGAGMTGMLPGTENAFSGIFDSVGAIDAPWGVNPVESGVNAGGLDGALADSVANYSAGMGANNAFTYGAGAGGGFDFANYINSGSINGGTPNAVPSLPVDVGGNGVGLFEAAQKLGQSAGGSVLSNLFGGNSDLTSLLGSLGAAGLGAYGANQQADSFGDLSQQYLNMGAPYRDKLYQSYQPGFDLAQADPAFQGALDQAGQSAARATSARVGNPVDNPGAYAEMQKYITNSVALPQLNTYRSQLGTFGQFGTNQAGSAQSNQIQSQGGMYDALGYGLGQITQPESPLKGLLDQYGRSPTINSFWRT
jgi:hypothetical protein